MSDAFSKARAAPRVSRTHGNTTKVRTTKAELLARIERLEAARRLIEAEIRELTQAYIAPQKEAQ